jgi:hypothetical protein
MVKHNSSIKTIFESIEALISNICMGLSDGFKFTEAPDHSTSPVSIVLFDMFEHIFF